MMCNPERFIVPLTLLLVLAGCARQAIQSSAVAPDIRPEHSPGQALVWAEKGQNALASNKPGAAIEAFRNAVALDPANAPVVNNLALLLQAEHRFAEAAEVLQQGLVVSPDVAELHYNLAVISELYLLDLDQALKHYQRYRALTPEDDSVVAGWVADLERRLQ
ncbi:MAG TPA: tetratricopeptide repeat protein [Marinobacter sp.]|jgi:tetratricopeptide (TPR) repeat protein|nr:tetratricopeptide repeat protein [Marinobacter sp.]